MNVFQLTDSFTRPGDTSSYADGDLVANSTTAGEVVPLEFNPGDKGAHVVGIRITKTDESDVSNADFSLRLFSEEPTSAAGDNEAMSHDVAGHLATIDVGAMAAYTDDASVLMIYGHSDFAEGIYVPGKVWALVEANAAYGPANAEVFTVTLTCVNKIK